MGVRTMEQYDILATAAYILDHGFSRVALQFPDELLETSVEVTSLLRSALSERRHGINLYVMADTTYGSCCVDEVAAAHVDAQCVIHYGHACLSQTSRLPVFFVFGRGRINTHHCSQEILGFSPSDNRPLLVLFGLQYAHAIEDIKREVEVSRDGGSGIVVFAEVPSCEMEPLRSTKSCVATAAVGGCSQGACTPRGCNGSQVSSGCSTCSSSDAASVKNLEMASEEELKQERVETSQLAESIGGLKWSLPKDAKMEDVAILWIGDEGAALTNLLLTYNKNTVVRYNAEDEVIVKDLPSKSRDLMRRFALVERAKDASIVGIVVGTLGVAGYNEAIQRVREIVASAGKKSYTMLMGRPNPAKLANFPECDVFVLVACSQTVLLDSKEYLAPLITPFEAELAFVEGREWTGAFNLELGQLPKPREELLPNGDEPSTPLTDNGDEDASTAIILSEATERALQLRPPSSLAVASSGRKNSGVTSSAEYFALRSYQGLEIHNSEAGKDNSTSGSGIPVSYEVVEGRTGRAAVYSDEAANV
ncbi:hypothetical protein KC19_1G282000 [Ceratodon purpureus]|uniref:2-(3-amino-3-carboxypropyl)histidine synthase subunit 2 n=1 Tax=Ceratodon purpureus TaxID=3225 RepID=A0A8T0JA73_CERPU|nr:hypothetical protein KC19_1G282000 [Ceratodon purpureus]KAG0592801.1 hypothetical protein KC19_1G282000 [Ceratodon purpureus]KAG0592802.1 hypothetical protein KC19_1G282000 [Ceratodon purpureus]